jgi:hypothetical protein
VRMADNLTTFKRRLSRNLGASTSWNPVGLSRPVVGLLYLFFYLFTFIFHNSLENIVSAFSVRRFLRKISSIQRDVEDVCRQKYNFTLRKQQLYQFHRIHILICSYANRQRPFQNESIGMPL